MFYSKHFLGFKKSLPNTILSSYNGIPCLELPEGCSFQVVNPSYFRLWFLNIEEIDYFNSVYTETMTDSRGFALRVKANHVEYEPYIPIRVEINYNPDWTDFSSRETLDKVNFFIYENRLFIHLSDSITLK